MKIKCLFVQRKGMYAGENAPELLCAVDEFTDEENPSYFEDLCKAELKSLSGDDIQASRVIEIEVDPEKIRSLLVDTPVVDGNIA